MATLMLTRDKVLGTMGLTALGLLSGFQERTRPAASESLGFPHPGPQHQMSESSLPNQTQVVRNPSSSRPSSQGLI